MAVSKIAPAAAKGVVVVAGVEGDVVGQSVHNGGEPFVEVVPVTASGFSSVVALEPARPLNRPHAGRRAGC